MRRPFSLPVLPCVAMLLFLCAIAADLALSPAGCTASPSTAACQPVHEALADARFREP